MKGGTLFSGIGAPECAAPFIDWRWASEIDDFASAVHAHRFPSIPNLGDVAKLKGQDIERPDVIVFGSPCQSYSVAGGRKGLGDPRGNLALVALALVAEFRPRWFVFENVPGLFSSFSGAEQAGEDVHAFRLPGGGDAAGHEQSDFWAFLRAVEEGGYTGAWWSPDAQYFGVPQRRERIFFVGHLGDDWRPSAAVLFEPESLSGHPPPGREAGPGVAALTSAGVGTCGADDNQAQAGHLICATGDQTHALTAEGFDASEDGTGRGNPIVASTGPLSHCLNAGGMGRQDFETETLVAFDTTQVTSKGNYSNPKPGDPCHPLAAGAHAPAVAFSAKDYGADAGATSPTLRAMGHDGSHPNAGGQVAAMVGPMVRRLTPTECERLQGFPDGWTDIPWRGKPAPDGRRYKALGNSMAVPVLRWILERLWIVDQETAALAAPPAQAARFTAARPVQPECPSGGVSTQTGPACASAASGRFFAGER